MNTKFLNRFNELEEQMKAVENTRHTDSNVYGGTSEYVNKEIFTEWKIKVKNLIVKSCGEQSEHYKEFIAWDKGSLGNHSFKYFKQIKSIFLAAKEDYEGGYITSARTLIQSEIFENQLEQAEELLKNGYLIAAAVIAGVVLETGLRELCDRKNIPHGKLDKMNADLAKAEVYNKLQQKRITYLADIRNNAAHGKQEEFTAEDVRDMIKNVNNFLADTMEN